MLASRRKTSLLCQQSFNRCTGGYVAIELELLAVAWEMEKFHHFLYASHFILETNQKPLEAILSKSINQATPRLQRILIRTFPYYFTVQYIPGITNQLAYCLSKLGGQKNSIKLCNFMLTRLPSSYALEVTIYNRLELLYKKMMSLHCSSIP